MNTAVVSTSLVSFRAVVVSVHWTLLPEIRVSAKEPERGGSLISKELG